MRFNYLRSGNDGAAISLLYYHYFGGREKEEDWNNCLNGRVEFLRYPFHRVFNTPTIRLQ